MRAIVILKEKFLFLTVLAFLTLCSFAANAQQSYAYANGHGGFSIPLNKEFSEQYSFGAGVDIGGGISVLNTYLTGRIGFTQFFKSPKNTYGTMTYIPIKFGLRHYLIEEYLFIYGDAGFAFINNDRMYKNETKFTGGGGFGLKFPNDVEFELGYQGVNGKFPYTWLSWVELKVGYNLPL